MNTWHWISIDPAARSGFAFWAGETLIGFGTLRPKGDKGRWTVEFAAHRDAPAGAEVFEVAEPGRCSANVVAWERVFGMYEPRVVVMEHAYGPSTLAVASLADRRGFIRALAERRGARVEEINTGIWRRCARERWGCNWTSEGEPERLKDLARSLVREHFDAIANGDEANAILVGHAALRTRVVDLTASGWAGAAVEHVADTPKPGGRGRKGKSKANALTAAVPTIDVIGTHADGTPLPVVYRPDDAAGALADRLF